MSDKATFEAIVLRELNSAWKSYVHKFGWQEYGLLTPNFILKEANVSHIGCWVTSSREMSFSHQLVNNRPWNEVLEVLKHEMAHQFVHEVLGVHTETAHGPTFQSVCKKFAIDGTATGGIDASRTTTTNHIVEKVQHLLKLAGNAGATDAEKEAAASAAHTLMLKYNIELDTKNEERGYTVRYLGGVTGRIQAYMSQLANLLSKYYFVEVIWMNGRDPRTGKEGHELEISGTAINVEVAEYVYDFLAREAVDAWERKFADPAFKFQLQEGFAVGFSQGRFTSPRGYTISARSNFLEGFVQGFMAQLKQADIKERQAGMVLAKDTGLEEFYHNRHPHIRQLSRGGGQYNSNMRGAGFAQGNALKVPNVGNPRKTSTPLLGR